MLEAAVRAGAVTLTEDLEFAGLQLAQGSHARRRMGLKSRLRAMEHAGMTVPAFERLRLEAADALLDEAERSANYDGMQTRLARGDHRERGTRIGTPT